MLKSMLSLTLALRSAALVPRAAQQPRRATIRMMSDEKVADFSKIDLRVGTIVSAWNHPDSDKLIVEEIDIGEDEPRQIVSGLRAFYEADALAGKKCVVVANLPKAKLGGVDSFGMVLCGSKDEKAVVDKRRNPRRPPPWLPMWRAASVGGPTLILVGAVDHIGPMGPVAAAVWLGMCWWLY